MLYLDLESWRSFNFESFKELLGVSSTNENKMRDCDSAWKHVADAWFTHSELCEGMTSLFWIVDVLLQHGRIVIVEMYPSFLKGVSRVARKFMPQMD